MQKLDRKAIWLFFFQNLTAIFLLLPLLLFVSFFIFGTLGRSGVAYDTVGNLLSSLISIPVLIGLIVLYIVASFIGARLTYDNWKYELSDSVLKIEKGVIWKKYVSIPYERIQNVDIYRGIFARLLGLSDIQVQTAGYSATAKGMGTEGRLPALTKTTAEAVRDSLIQKVKSPKQGL